MATSPEPPRQLAKSPRAIHTNDFDYAAALGAGGPLSAELEKARREHKAVFAATVHGEVPVGIDDRPSRAIERDPQSA